MRRAILIFAAMVIAAADPAAAEIIEIPLPTLQGWYGIDEACICYGEAFFQLERMPIVISSVAIRLSGTATVGQYTCDFGIGPQSYPFRFYFSASMRDTVSGYLWGAYGDSPEESGAFEFVAPFKQVLSRWPVSWDFLMAGYSRVNLTAMPEGIIVDCGVLDWPSATIEAATLIVEGEFKIAVDQSTWGSIKALFR